MFLTFPRFPKGFGGLGLLVARLAGAALAGFCGLTLTSHPLPRAALMLTGLALAIGVLARPAALILALAVLAASGRTGGDLRTVLALGAVQLLALVLTGPGAYSLDARLFGQRVIRVRRDRTSV